MSCDSLPTVCHSGKKKKRKKRSRITSHLWLLKPFALCYFYGLLVKLEGRCESGKVLSAPHCQQNTHQDRNTLLYPYSCTSSQSGTARVKRFGQFPQRLNWVSAPLISPYIVFRKSHQPIQWQDCQSCWKLCWYFILCNLHIVIKEFKSFTMQVILLRSKESETTNSVDLQCTKINCV